MDDNILNNIAFGQEKEEIDFEKINLVVELSDLKKFVSNQKFGLKTRVGERGAKLWWPKTKNCNS